MEPRAWVFHAFFQVKAHSKSQGWWYISPCKGFDFLFGLAKMLSWELWFFFVVSQTAWPFLGRWGEVEAMQLLEYLVL